MNNHPQNRPLTPKQLQCIHYLVYSDMNKSEIAKTLGVSNAAISRWLNKEDFNEAIKEEVHRGFDELAIKARKRLESIIDSNHDGYALAACKEVLHHSAFDVPQKLEVGSEININID